MKLITEVFQDVEYIKEQNEEGVKSLFIQGVFMESNKTNKNGRRYNKAIVEREVDEFQQLIKEKRALGELGHPPSPSIGLNNASHLITELKMVGEDAYGKAKILSTPMGKIAENLIQEGVRLGVSLRGLGSIKTINGINEVQDDFKLSTVDIVADPSAPSAFVEGILESKEWIFENGVWKSIDLELAAKQLKNTPKSRLSEEKLRIFQRFLGSIK